MRILDAVVVVRVQTDEDEDVQRHVHDQWNVQSRAPALFTGTCVQTQGVEPRGEDII